MSIDVRRVLFFSVAAIAPCASARAAESATSVYLLGSKGSMAGVVPPPGTYVADASYYYAGDASGTAALGVTLRRTGARDTGGIPITVSADVSVDGAAYYNIPTATWVSSDRMIGGNFGLSLMLPVGWKSVDARIDAEATLTLPPPLSQTITAGRSFAFSDDNAAFGDPLITAFLGWHEGNLHTSLGLMVNVPIGQWSTTQLANIGFNHWAFDLTGAVTWLDPNTGLELSGAAGFTFNTENPDSDYKSGTDFHLEFAAMQRLSKQFAIGVTGYHYQQISGDSGAGAALGDFEGRVTAIGPALTYDFAVGQLPVMTSLKWMHEFNAENRLEGDMGFLTVAIPLGPPPPH
jgi:hypothetical protein